MTLYEICEPFFQYVCRVNRSARKAGNVELVQVQNEVRGLFAEARGKAGSSGLGEQWTKVEMPLMVFCDAMIKESSLPWAGEWRDLSTEKQKGSSVGGDPFFAALEAAMQDNSPESSDRLAVFYACMGLGYSGKYRNDPESLRRQMREIAGRLQAAGRFTDAQRICADAYEKVDTRDLVQPPGTKLVGIGIALAGLIVVLFFTYAYLYRESAQKLTKALEAVETKAKSAGSATAAPDTGKEAGK